MISFIKVNWKVATFSAIMSVLLAEIWSSVHDAIAVVDWRRTGANLIDNGNFQSGTAGLLVPAIFILWFYRRFKFSKEQPEPLFRLMFVGMSLGHLSIIALHTYIGDADKLVAGLQQDVVTASIVLLVPLFMLVRWAVLAIRNGQGAERR